MRSERLERSFAHVCQTGGARRTWVAGIENVQKRYLISAAAHNLGLLMRSLFKMGTPRGLQQFKTGLKGVLSSVFLAWIVAGRLWKRLTALATSPSSLRNSPAGETRLALAT